MSFPSIGFSFAIFQFNATARMRGCDDARTPERQAARMPGLWLAIKRTTTLVARESVSSAGPKNGITQLVRGRATNYQHFTGEVPLMFILYDSSKKSPGGQNLDVRHNFFSLSSWFFVLLVLEKGMIN